MKLNYEFDRILYGNIHCDLYNELNQAMDDYLYWILEKELNMELDAIFFRELNIGLETEIL